MDHYRPHRRTFSRSPHRKGATPGKPPPAGQVPLATSSRARQVVCWYLATAIEHLGDDAFTRGTRAAREARLSDAFQATGHAWSYLASKSVPREVARALEKLTGIEKRLGMRRGGR